MRVEDLLRDCASLLDGRPALVAGDRELTAPALDLMSSRMAAALAANGVGRGSIVPVLMDNGWEAIVSILAILRTGAAFAPVDTSVAGDALAALLNESRATSLVTEARFVRATATAMSAAPGLRFIIIAGCEGSPGIDGIMRFEDAVGTGPGFSEAEQDAAIEAGADQPAATALGRLFHGFVTAARGGETFVVEKSEGYVDAAA
jgi:long-chain acyl-CoA synthetase